ncbi:MAG TPA: CapA family protein [Steroidobacteraceae bacterium]|nr:CapA family protein [Steroidobacteraceae bacterium]
MLNEREQLSVAARKPPLITLFLCGDVMTGRGIDQILPHPGNPRLYEPYVRSAKEYVELAEQVSGPIDRPVGFAYVWGDALSELERRAPHARIVNLETAVTTSENAWPGKGIHYRMHPANVPCLTALSVDCCVLANNHVMDWGREGLFETMRTLAAAGIRTAGAGRDAAEASTPAAIELAGRSRVLIFAFGMPSSGVPGGWRATAQRAGVNLLTDLSSRSVDKVAQDIGAHKRDDDIAVVSLHWGPNWGFDVSALERRFAHALLERAGADVVHGHSSHHVKGIEVHRDKLILYGCGDFLTDYEGITGHEAYRGGLSLMYFPTLDSRTGHLRELVLTPTRMHRLRVTRAEPEQTEWLRETLVREGRQFGTTVERQVDGTLRLRWS